MKIVKNGMFKREYYNYYKGLQQIELYEYVWDSSINKFVPNFNMIIDRNVSIEKWNTFKADKRNKGFLTIEEVLKIGTIRK